MTTIIDGSAGVTFPNGSNPQAAPSKVLQVVQGKLSSSFSTASTTAVDTGLTATITPLFNTSKILCFVTVNGIRNSGTTYNTYLYLNRNGTYLDATSGNSFNLYFTANQLFGRVGTVADMVLDSPATTSACTYKLQIAVENSSSTSYISDQASQLTPSTIILMEIAQ